MLARSSQWRDKPAATREPGPWRGKPASTISTFQASESILHNLTLMIYIPCKKIDPTIAPRGWGTRAGR